MRILLDTHVLLWALIEPHRLKPSVRSVLEDPVNEVLFSTASIWELSIKASLGRIDFDISLATIVSVALESGFTELPIRLAATLKVATLPHHHRDPFDRILIAQAMTEPAMLYTADSQLSAYSELVIYL